MSSAYNKFNAFVQDIGRKVHNLNVDTLRILLTNVAPVATNAVHSDLTEIASGNGYLNGGSNIPATAYSQSAGLATLTGSNVVFTAAGGTIGPFRYAVLLNGSEPGTGGTAPLIGWWDYGSSITLNSGETFTVDLSGGILTLQ